MRGKDRVISCEARAAQQQLSLRHAGISDARPSPQRHRGRTESYFRFTDSLLAEKHREVKFPVDALRTEKQLSPEKFAGDDVTALPKQIADVVRLLKGPKIFVAPSITRAHLKKQPPTETFRYVLPQRSQKLSDVIRFHEEVLHWNKRLFRNNDDYVDCLHGHCSSPAQ